ncbi:hypothetical protein [Nocardioides daeguensis]|uniref:Anti-sigma factor n=1 Tax=Nocardioides daeguensis TaxID=908359 RepID=A0ABP6WCI5_9ACTN|nr:hypothetical protein [Nocardioides daeguensis]MBV6728117.1 hypothetical protein [Nocardioides daeguensis]MCR1774191.1 hypothetical protein [Nocardioides daeguensis]
MNDATEPLTPAREEAIRRALADAGGPVPMPGDVAARIDDVIADLAAERTSGTRPLGGVHASHPEAVVVPLDAAARRRRRRVRMLLGAAAAVAVVSVGVGMVSDHQSQDDMTAAHDAAHDESARDSAGVAGTAGALDEAAKTAPEAAAPTRDDAAGAPSVEAQRVPTDQPVREVRAAHLREDLVALQRADLPHPREVDYSGATLTSPAGFMCDPADFGPGYLVGVQYDGKPAVVAFRLPVGSTQVAEVLACGTGDVIHSTTLAATD